MTAGPPRWHGWAQLGAAVLLLALLPALDGLGRVLALPVLGLLAVLGLRDLMLQPVLEASAEQVTVVDGLHRRSVPWSEVEGLRVVRDRRTPLLELDLGSTVVVMSGRRLGSPPAEVLEELEQLRP